MCMHLVTWGEGGQDAWVHRAVLVVCEHMSMSLQETLILAATAIYWWFKDGEYCTELRLSGYGLQDASRCQTWCNVRIRALSESMEKPRDKKLIRPKYRLAACGRCSVDWVHVRRHRIAMLCVLCCVFTIFPLHGGMTGLQKVNTINVQNMMC